MAAIDRGPWPRRLSRRACRANGRLRCLAHPMPDVLVSLHVTGRRFPVSTCWSSCTARSQHPCRAADRQGTPAPECLLSTKVRSTSSASRGARRSWPRRLRAGQGSTTHRPTAVGQIHDLRQADYASRSQPGLLEGRRSRHHPWRNNILHLLGVNVSVCDLCVRSTTGAL